jgi:phosphohistidine phosphatase SixA
MIVGHNPTIEETIQMLTDSSDVIAIPSCALAHLILPIEKWSNLSSKSKTEHQAALKEIIQPR